MTPAKAHSRNGFTLIELSIVLLIIGLLTGGVLVGRDLVKSAAERAQISQIEKYNQAVLAFAQKFNSIPGDMNSTLAAKFGFTVGTNCDGSALGRRDGNGIIDGWPTQIYAEGNYGETALFWQDISSPVAGNLIDGQFPNSGGVSAMCSGAMSSALTTTPGPNSISAYFPAGKIGNGTFVYVYEASGANWFGLSTISQITLGGVLMSTPAIPVRQAYNIDKKIDDGQPLTGTVQAVYLNNSFSTLTYAPSATVDSATTCYNTTSNAYSISSIANYGAGGNCALSFQFSSQ